MCTAVLRRHLVALRAFGVLTAQTQEHSVPVAAISEGLLLLEQVDRLRHPWSAFCMEVGRDDGRRRQSFRVHTRENGDTRVEGLSEKERGSVVLVLGERIWPLVPGVCRPVPVTPQQRLLGVWRLRGRVWCRDCVFRNQKDLSSG